MTNLLREFNERHNGLPHSLWPATAAGITYWILVLSQYPALWIGKDANAGPMVVGTVFTFIAVWQLGERRWFDE